MATKISVVKDNLTRLKQCLRKLNLASMCRLKQGGSKEEEQRLRGYWELF